jgi:hypothetical protein
MMAKFIVELSLDGYENEDEMEAACEEFIYEQLNFAGSSVKITKVERPAPPVPKCCVCETTENLYRDGWYGWRCRDIGCVPF